MICTLDRLLGAIARLPRLVIIERNLSRRSPVPLLVLLVLAVWAISPSAYALRQSKPTKNVPETIETIARRFSGRMGLAAIHLESGESIFLNADERFQTASVIKLPIMVEAFFQAKAGHLKLDETVTYNEADRVPGSGILQDLSPGTILKLVDAITLMIVLSDNLATNLVIERVGIENVNTRMVSLGLKNTKLFKKVFLPAKEPVSDEAKRFGLGVTTPREMMLLLQRLARGELPDAASSERMIQILKKQRDRDQIPRYLGQIDLGGKIEVANKSGALDVVRNDVGIVYTPRGRVALAVFCAESADKKWTADNEATLAIARAAEAAVRELLITRVGTERPPTAPEF